MEKKSLLDEVYDRMDADDKRKVRDLTEKSRSDLDVTSFFLNLFRWTLLILSKLSLNSQF